MDVVSVPIGIWFQQPEIFGTLSVGFALHESRGTVPVLTNSECVRPRRRDPGVHAAAETWQALARCSPATA